MMTGCVRYVGTAYLLHVASHAMQLGVDSVGLMAEADNDWLAGLSTHGDMKCSVEDECIIGSGMGACKVMLNPSVAIQIGSTDSGHHCEIALNGSLKHKRVQRAARLDTPKSDIIITGHSQLSHWNLCWKQDARRIDRPGLRVTGVESFCYYVNGLCFLWASPCSGGCSQLGAHSSYSSFCPGLRYATEAEWSAALPSLNAGRPAFYSKCAVMQLDPQWHHCDYSNAFVRVEDGSYNELVLVCGVSASVTGSGIAPSPTPSPTPYPTAFPTPHPTAHPTPHPTAFPTPFPTPSPTPYPTAFPTPFPTPRPTPHPTPSPTPSPTHPPGWLTPQLPMAGGSTQAHTGGVASTGAGSGVVIQGSISAVGDPHLQNVHGERFDLMRPGTYALIHIPKGEPVEDTLLRVEADVRRLGGQCADLYFQELNVTGAWAEARYTGGLRFQARGVFHEQPKWAKFGKVQIKVAHGRTQQGIQYLNFYVKHLVHTGFAVGGLLGEDDHKEAAKPSPACVHHTSLLQIGSLIEKNVPFSVAEASFT